MTNEELEAAITALVPFIKRQLKYKSNSVDEDIEEYAYMALEELKISGNKLDLNNKLVKLAIVEFCRARFALDNDQADRHYKSYETIRDKITLLEAPTDV